MARIHKKLDNLGDFVSVEDEEELSQLREDIQNLDRDDFVAAWGDDEDCVAVYDEWNSRFAQDMGWEPEDIVYAQYVDGWLNGENRIFAVPEVEEAYRQAVKKLAKADGEKFNSAKLCLTRWVYRNMPEYAEQFYVLVKSFDQTVPDLA